MTSDDLTARLIVLETLIVGIGSVALSHERDPDQERASRLLAHLREAATGLAAEVAPAAKSLAHDYAERLSALILANLRNHGPADKVGFDS